MSNVESLRSYGGFKIAVPTELNGREKDFESRATAMRRRCVHLIVGWIYLKYQRNHIAVTLLAELFPN